MEVDEEERVMVFEWAWWAWRYNEREYIRVLQV